MSTSNSVGPFTLTESDLVAAARLHSTNSLKQPRTVIILAILWLAYLIFLVFVGGGLEEALRDWFVILPISFAPILVLLLLPFLIVPWQARRMFRQQRSLQGELTFSWSDGGLHVVSEYGTFEIPWDHFVRSAESKTMFVLLESDRLYRPVPKRVLTTQQCDSLRSYLARIRT